MFSITRWILVGTRDPLKRPPRYAYVYYGNVLHCSVIVVPALQWCCSEELYSAMEEKDIIRYSTMLKKKSAATMENLRVFSR